MDKDIEEKLKKKDIITIFDKDIGYNDVNQYYFYSQLYDSSLGQYMKEKEDLDELNHEIQNFHLLCYNLYNKHLAIEYVELNLKNTELILYVNTTNFMYSQLIEISNGIENFEVELERYSDIYFNLKIERQ